MKDTTKKSLSCAFFLFALVLPIVSLAIGWIGWDIRVGAIAGFVTFAIFFVLGGVFTSLIEDLSWLSVCLPFTLGVFYAIIPDFIPLPFDDAIAVSAGAIITFALALKKDDNVPKWIIFPLLLSGLYTLVGGIIPGPVDELLVSGIMTGVAIGGTYKKLQTSQVQLLSSEEDEETEVLNPTKS